MTWLVRRAGPASRQGRPPLIIWCCEDNRRSDGGRRPQRRRLPDGRRGWRSAGPGRGPVRPGGAAPAGPGVRARAAGGPAAQELLDDRRARRRRQPRRDAAPAGAGRSGTPTRSATTCAATWSSTSATPGRCWSSTRPATSRRAASTVGVQRQYTGTAGRIENAQVAVYLAYASRRRARLDRPGAVPAPEAGSTTPRAAGRRRPRPGRVCDQAGPGPAMLARALDAGVPAGWVTGDEVYGADPGLRAELEARGIGYVLAVACDHRVRSPAAPPSAPTLCSGASRRGPGSGVRRPRRQGPPLLRLGVHPPGRRRPAAATREASAGCWSAATSTPASWPSTAAGRPARSRWPPWYGSPGAAGPSRSASRPARAWSAWTSTRSAAGAPGTAGSPWPCSPTPSWSWPPLTERDPPPTTVRADQLDLQRDPAPVRHPGRPSRSLTPATGCAGRCGDDDIKPAPAPATTDNRPADHEDHDLDGCYVTGWIRQAQWWG